MEAQIRNWISAGRGGPGLSPTWNGNGITSSTAATRTSSRSVGYADNGSLPLMSYAVFMGQNVDGTSVLVRYTVWGDTNLDGIVDDDDVTVQSAFYAPGVSGNDPVALERMEPGAVRGPGVPAQVAGEPGAG